MNRLLTIAILCQAFFLVGQVDLNSEVNYLNYDPFYESNDLNSDPVLPALSSTEDLGYDFPWVSKKEKYKHNYLSVFPVLSAIGSYQSDVQNTSSVYTGAGFGITGQFTKKFYARLILTGNYTHREGSSAAYSSIYRTNFWEDQN